MKGAVLIIGSLLWESKENSLDKKQGELRENWRQELDLDNKVEVKVPIRYGRKSTTRRCTYTMAFSNSVMTLGTAFIVPFKKESESFEDIKSQALSLAEAEGISTKRNPKLIATWGAVGITFNNTIEKRIDELQKKWHKEFDSFDNQDFKIGTESPSIQKDGELNFTFNIPSNIDYVFATPVKPELSEYPTIERIIGAIIESKPRYDTYLKENIKSGIRVKNDDEILKQIEEKPVANRVDGSASRN